MHYLPLRTLCALLFCLLYDFRCISKAFRYSSPFGSFMQYLFIFRLVTVEKDKDGEETTLDVQQKSDGPLQGPRGIE